jgi:ribosomal protein S6--L-glutamate ligase
MRFAILSSGSGWHVRELQRAATLLNHETVVVDFRRMSAAAGADLAPWHGIDGVLVRTMVPGSLEQVVFRMDVLNRLEASGLAVVNPAKALETCVDKYLTTARLAAACLPVPPTVACQTADDALKAYEMLGRDVVVKPLFGSEGRGMLRLTDPELAWRTFHVLERTQAVLYLQQFVRHCGWDVRAFVIDGEVVAAMRRHAAKGWRTNVAQGGKAEAVRLDVRESRLAIQASEAVGTLVAGVDLLPGADGQLYVLEVNAVPGWRALTAATGKDLAERVVKFVEARASAR